MYCLWNDTNTARRVTHAYLKPDSKFKKNFFGFQNLGKRHICVVKYIFAILFKIWHCKIYFIWGWISLQRRGKRWLERSHRKKRGWTINFSHLPDSSLTPFHPCSCLKQRTRTYVFSLKRLWSSDNLFTIYYSFETLQIKINRRFLATIQQTVAACKNCVFYTQNVLTNRPLSGLTINC